MRCLLIRLLMWPFQFLFLNHRLPRWSWWMMNRMLLLLLLLLLLPDQHQHYRQHYQQHQHQHQHQPQL